MNQRENYGKIAYMHDVKRRPFYPDGKPRLAWEDLSDIARESWMRKTEPQIKAEQE